MEGVLEKRWNGSALLKLDAKFSIVSGWVQHKPYFDVLQKNADTENEVLKKTFPVSGMEVQ